MAQALRDLDGGRVREPHTGAVHATLTFYLHRTPRHGQQRYPDHGGDVDNYAKMVLDAFNGCMYVDDRQIVSLTAQKRFCSGGGEPRTEMEFLLDLEDDEEEGVIDLTV